MALSPFSRRKTRRSGVIEGSLTAPVEAVIPAGTITTGYFVVGNAPLGATVKVDGEEVDPNDLTSSASGGFVPGAMLVVSVPPGTHDFDVTTLDGSQTRRLSRVTVRPSIETIGRQWDRTTASSIPPGVYPLTTRWDDMPIATTPSVRDRIPAAHTPPRSRSTGGIVIIDKMPEGAGISIDGSVINQDASPKGRAVGWIGGLPGALKQFVLREVPPGRRRLVIGPTADGSTKTFDVNVANSVEPIDRLFTLDTGGRDPSTEVTTIYWDRQPSDAGSGGNGGGGVASSDAISLSISPTMVAVNSGTENAAQYRVQTTALGDVTGAAPVTLAVRGSTVSGDDLAAYGITASFDPPAVIPGEGSTLTLRAPASAPVGTARFYVGAVGIDSVVAGELKIEPAAPAGSDESEDKPSGLSTPAVLAIVTVVAVGAYFALRDDQPRQNPSKSPAKSFARSLAKITRERPKRRPGR